MKRESAGTKSAWRHESTRQPFVRIAVGFAIGVTVLAFAHAGLKVWVHAHAGGPPPAAVAPPPVLPAPPAHAEGAPDYRWVDRDKGIAEIPIERAMQLLAVDGGGSGDNNHDNDSANDSGVGAGAAAPEGVK